MSLRPPATTTAAMLPEIERDTLGTVITVTGKTCRVQLAGGDVVSGIDASGVLVGQTLRMRYAGGAYVVQGGAGGGSSGGGSFAGSSGGITGAPSPHDLLGVHHNLPTLVANLFLSSPVSASGLPAFRAIGPADLPGQFAGFANPTAQIGMTAINGSAATAMRSDAAPAINAAIAPTWSGVHTFGAGAAVSSSQVVEFGWNVAGKQTDAGKVGYQTFSTALDIVGAGTVSGSRAVRLWDDTTIVRAVGSPSFASGFTGSGWRVDQGIAYASQSTAEFDNLTVRGLMRVYELLIQKIRTGNGSYLFAPGGKVASVSGTGPYTLTFESDHGLAANDLIRAQKFDLAFGGVYQSNLTVTSVSSTTVLTATLSSGVAPLAGYEYARVGNTSDTNRQGGVYVTSDDSNAPYLDVFDGINAFSAWGSTAPKARLGRLAGITDPLWGALSGYGLYTQSGYFTGGIRAMSGRIDGVLDIGTSGGIYQGSGSFASPSTGLKIFSSSGVGIIAGYNAGAVQWQAGTDGKLYAGGGIVKLDSSGVTVSASTTGSSGTSAYKFSGNSYTSAGLYAYYTTSPNDSFLNLLSDLSSSNSSINVMAYAAGAYKASISLTASNVGWAAALTINQSQGIYLTSPNGVGINTSASGTAGDLSVANRVLVNGTSLQGTAGRNYFKDGESVSAGLGGNGLRVGAAWNMYGIYAEAGYCVVGGASGANLQNGVVQITSGVGILRASIDATYNALAVNGGVHLTGSNTTYQMDARDNSGQTWQSYAESNTYRIWVTGAGDVIRFDNGGNASKLSAGTAWTSFSDERVKNVKGAYTKGLSEILRIQPIVYDYNSKAGTISNGKNNAGIIAQEIREIFPDAVSVDHDTGMLMFDSTEITWALVNAVKEVAARVKKLEHHYH